MRNRLSHGLLCMFDLFEIFSYDLILVQCCPSGCTLHRSISSFLVSTCRHYCHTTAATAACRAKRVELTLLAFPKKKEAESELESDTEANSMSFVGDGHVHGHARGMLCKVAVAINSDMGHGVVQNDINIDMDAKHPNFSLQLQPTTTTWHFDMYAGFPLQYQTREAWYH